MKRKKRKEKNVYKKWGMAKTYTLFSIPSVSIEYRQWNRKLVNATSVQESKVFTITFCNKYQQNLSIHRHCVT
jgi:hypothetical protein